VHHATISMPAFNSPDLGSIPDPQLILQLSQQSLEPAGMSTRFHPHTHAHPLRPEIPGRAGDDRICWSCWID
jgi:hypothetical protein